MATNRIYTRMPLERAKIIRAAADEAGLSYSQFAGMLTWMGFKAYQRQVNPESILSMEQLVELGKIYDKELQQGDETD